MNSENESLQSNIVVSAKANPDLAQSNLAKRGLEDNERDSMTPEEIAIARHENSQYRGLSDETVQLAVKQPRLWECRLYLQALIDEVDGYESLRQARSLGFTIDVPELVSLENTYKWLSSFGKDLAQTLGRLDGPLNHDLQTALGPPGNAFEIIKVVRQVGLVYKHILESSIRCANAEHDQIFDGAFRELSKMSDRTLQEFEEFPRRSLSTVMNALALPPSDNAVTIKLTMTLTADSEPYIAEHRKTEDACIAKLLSLHGKQSI